MKPSVALAVAGALAWFLLPSCTEEREPNLDVTEGSISGEVTRVDELLGALWLTQGGRHEWKFMLSADTRIRAGQTLRPPGEAEGTRVVVHYLGRPGSLRATRIEILSHGKNGPEIPPE